MRLETDVLARVEQFRVESGIATHSQALRMLVELGLSKTDQLEATWRATTWREGVRVASQQARDGISRVISSTMGKPDNA